VTRPYDALPKQEREELEEVLRIIFTDFHAAIDRATTQWRMRGRIVKVVCYGGGAEGSLASATSPIINLLVVVNDKRLTNHSKFWAAIERRLSCEQRFGATIRREVHLLLYSSMDVFREVQKGSKFFIDVLRTGTALYDDETTGFGAPGHLSDAKARATELAHFNYWYPRSVNARRLAAYSLAHGMPADAAFLLHQATERVYHCVLLVLTHHSPKTHRLELLRSNAERVAPILARAWPRDAKFERRAFNRLSRAYGDGRYDPAYRVTADELRWMDERIGQLQELVRIEKAIQILPRLTREVFTTRRAEGLGYEAIAARLGLTVTQVESRLEQALDSIMRDLKNSPWRPSEPEKIQ
jgi:DNA-directed RNA polymerase specialized sigma24 family protein